MSIDQPKFSDAIKPQDAMAVIITLMGVAIALFLPDAVIKLIGGSIAVLGAIALYITLKQRISDSVQLKQRRTTLPTPSFKTRVVTDPITSTTRIRFDDFQETFAPVDEPHADDGEFSVVERTNLGAAPTSSFTAPLAEREVPARHSATETSRSFGSDDFGDDDPFVNTGGESFRVIRTVQAPVSDERTLPVESLPSKAEHKSTGNSGIPYEPAPIGDDRSHSVAAHTSPGITDDSIPAALPADDGAPKRRQANLDIMGLIEADASNDTPANEPREEFVRLVGQVLNAIARSIQGRSIVFFWINFEKGHLIPEAFVTNGSRAIRGAERIRLGGDIVSQIARSGVPEIITDITAVAERELITYYNAPSGTRSFVGVPVFFRREVVGVLAADSNEESGFDESSVATLAEYTRLIAGLIRSYTEKYDLHLVARTLEAFEGMGKRFAGGKPDPVQVADLLVESVAELFDPRYAAVVLFDPVRGEWSVEAAAGPDAPLLPARSVSVDMHGSLVGRSTRFAEQIVVEGPQSVHRFVPQEDLADAGTLLVIPLVATTKCYGALVVEHPVAGAWIPRDVELMRDLAGYAAMAVEVFNTNRVIDSHTMLDETTGLYNAEFVEAALDREIMRARDFRAKLSLALISIDLPASLRAGASSEIEEIVAASVGSMIQSAVRQYDTVGRYKDGLFAAVLVARNDQDAYLWAEKLRKEVASRILALGARKSAVTISVGIADLGDTDGRDAMIAGAHQALDRARGSEGNAVILY